MNNKISLKNRILMAYKGKPFFISNKQNYYRYSSEWTFLLLIFTGWIFDIIILLMGILIAFTLTSNILFNIFIAFFIFPVFFSRLIQFFAFLLLPIQEITKEEYEQELEKINEQEKTDEVSKQEKKKSFFQRYKEYKIKKI
jgi:hypothetical protein